jgi:hypothetical protein
MEKSVICIVATGRAMWKRTKLKYVSYSRSNAMKQALTIVMIAVFALCGACVKPYEREFLADPIMSFSRDPISDKHRQHVFEVRESARGAEGSEGGGCGCN